MIIFSGVGLNHDYAIGKALKYGNSSVVLKTKEEAGVFIDKFHQVRESALQQVEALYNKIIQQSEKEEADIFLSHKLLLTDDIVIQTVENNIKSGLCLIESLKKAMNEYVSMFKTMESEVFSSKSNDIMDIFMRMIDIAKGINLPIVEPKDDFILCCEELLPSYLYRFDNTHLKGIVVKYGCSASHGVILAKKKNIPLIINVPDYERICNNDKLLINGGTGKILFIDKSKEIL